MSAVRLSMDCPARKLPIGDNALPGGSLSMEASRTDRDVESMAVSNRWRLTSSAFLCYANHASQAVFQSVPRRGRLAQWIERWSPEPKVAGSIPASPSK